MLSFLTTSFLALFLFLIPVKNPNVNNNYPNKAKQNKNSTSLNQKIADAYGIGSFSKIKSIKYTFNVEINGKDFNRTWLWNPNTKEVEFWGKDKNGKNIHVSYNKNKPLNDSTKKIDASFINDNYWLLFPFHLVWDRNVKFTDAGMKKYPIGKGMGECLKVKYADNVGYTPGDEFDLYLNKNNMIKEWVYKRAGKAKNSFPSTWEGVKNFDGVKISTKHYGRGKKFKLWFSGIKVELKKHS